MLSAQWSVHSYVDTDPARHAGGQLQVPQSAAGRSASTQSQSESVAAQEEVATGDDAEAGAGILALSA